jgi:hypothetical protein
VEALRQSWVDVCTELQAVTHERVMKCNTIFPAFDTAHIFANGFSDSDQAEIKRMGAFVCRTTIPEDEANALYKDMSKYVADNIASIRCWPEQSPSLQLTDAKHYSVASELPQFAASTEWGLAWIRFDQGHLF